MPELALTVRETKTKQKNNNIWIVLLFVTGQICHPDRTLHTPTLENLGATRKQMLESSLTHHFYSIQPL